MWLIQQQCLRYESLPLTSYSSCHGIFCICTSFSGLKIMSSIYQTPAIPSCPVPGNTLTWQCHPAEHTLPAGQDCLFAFAQSLTLCCGDEEVATAPDLTSHPSFCLVPGCCGCDEKHICSHFK